MKERWKNDDGSETILVTGDPPRPSLFRRLSGLIGWAILVLLVSLLPLYLFVKGITGLVTGKLSMWSRMRGLHTLYGQEAIGWSWMLIGFAIGSIPFVFREQLAGRTKWLLYLVAAVCFAPGIYRLVRGT